MFKAGKITALFCTSTLVEGVNLPADNLFITDYRNGQKDMRPIDFRNLVGRVGRLEFNLYGNVFLVATSEKASDKFETLLSKSVDKQTLSIEKGLTKPQKQNVINVLLQGDVEFPKHPQKQTEASLIQEVKDGRSISVTYVFVLDDDSPVEVLIGEPTADQTTIGKKLYFEEN